MAQLGDLTLVSARRVAEAIRRREVSSLEVVDACLRRIEETRERLNAVVLLLADAARDAARDADGALARGIVRGPLHGVPMTIKDSIDTAGVVTTAGTLGRRGYVPAEDATVVARLRAAGAVLLGKTNTPELTLAAETANLVYGRTNNPFDLARTPGGSSGGSAAILAVGGSPLELGSDTGGSIRMPSNWCGTAGIKPTSGRVPRTGHFAPALGFTQSYTQIGPMARQVEDLVLALPLIAGPDGRDPFVVEAPLGDPGAIDVSSLRVSYHTDNGVTTPAAAVRDTVERAARALADAGAAVEEARPPGAQAMYEAAAKLLLPDGGAWIRKLLDEAGTTEPHPWIAGLLALPAWSAAELAAAAIELDTARAAMLRFLAPYDVILCPVSSAPAVPHGGTFAEGFAGAFSYTFNYNATGWPGAVVRCGTSPEGLPIGVQVLSRPFREDIVLAAALHLERALGGWQPPPMVAATRREDRVWAGSTGG
jgi:amidase